MVDAPEPDASADKHVRGEGWQHLPFSLFANWFLGQQDWWEAATSDVRGVDPVHVKILRFAH